MLHSLNVTTGMTHALPANGPAASGCVLSSTSTVATISLSATGSRKAPKADEAFCKSEVTQVYSGKPLRNDLSSRTGGSVQRTGLKPKHSAPATAASAWWQSTTLPAIPSQHYRASAGAV